MPTPMPAVREIAPSPEKEKPAASVCYGNVIEYIQDKLYLALYTQPPNEHTPFPWPARSRRSSKSSPRRSPQKQTKGKSSVAQPAVVYFSMDSTLNYNAFHADFGPLHIGHLYRFAITLHEVLSDNPGKIIVFWSGADSKRRANAACMLACYVVLIQNWPPHLALAPIAQMDPPCMPFRDAGYSVADYGLTIQDVVYGVWKAKEEKICSLETFSLEEYEMFEQVYNGDFNWVTPHFIALASPQDDIQRPIAKTDPKYATIPHTAEEIQQCPDLPDAFKTVLTYFTHRNVGLVVRLNDPLYSPTFFTANGIQHLDMIFDDGTCPTLQVVRRFIRIAHEMITVKKKAIGVHCKAGLGRTGCLIGAYLIYRHGFTANEVIAYMRFMRPGMVVGPQQHWLHLNQNTFREWSFEDSMKARLAAQMPSTPPKVRAARAASAQCTPPAARSRAVLEEINSNEQSPTTAATDDCCAADDNMLLPAPTPGQPRKTSKSYGGRRSTAARGDGEPFILADADVVATERRERRRKQRDADALLEDSEAEREVRAMLRRASRSPGASPGASPSCKDASVSRENRRRVVSCTSAAAATGVRKASARVGSLGNSSAIKAK